MDGIPTHGSKFRDWRAIYVMTQGDANAILVVIDYPAHTIIRYETSPSRVYRVAYVDLIVDGEYIHAHSCLGDEMITAIASPVQNGF
jgi:hypothetical protein